MASKHSMDLTRGSVFKKLLVFAMPIMLTNLLQQLYHAADVVVVGNFARDSTVSLAAVGSTGSITTLFLNLFLGLSVGANVVCANLYGSREYASLRRAMHTSMVLAAVSGVAIGAAGFCLTRPMLEMMGSPDNVIDQATTYMKIIFLGQPGSLVYNFGAGILRAHGDTKRPMYILAASGVINVVLNLVFVIGFHLDAAGVALATIIAHYVSAAAILYILFHPHGEQHLSLTELSVHRKEVFDIVKIGIPCGFNGVVFSLSNVIIVSALNTLGDVVLAANSAAANVDAILYQILAAFYSACVSFAGQNFGARNLKRIDQLLGRSILLCCSVLIVVDIFIFLFPDVFMHLFTQDPAVVKMGAPRLFVMGGGYVIYSISEMAIGCLRGMGKSVLPTILNAFFICVPRVLWVLFIFPLHPAYIFLLVCYPVSWVLSATAQMFCYFYYRKKEARLLAAGSAEPT